MRALHVAACACILAIMISPTCLVFQVSGDAYDLESRLFAVLGANGIEKIEAFSSIQQAINEAYAGSIISIPSGTYYEHVNVNKSVVLVGQADLSTVVDGTSSGTVVQITADNVEVSYLKVQNSGYGWTNHGIYAYGSENCSIRNNHLFRTCHNIKLNYSRNSEVTGNYVSGIFRSPTMYGIRIENSINCTAVGNRISDCVGSIHLENATTCTVTGNYVFNNDQGVRLYSPCVGNIISENTVLNNTYDGMIETMPTNTTILSNIFYHNSFVNNTNPFIYKISGNDWDLGYEVGGNYWSNYTGTDENQDGIGDTPHMINSISLDRDRYPLMHPYGSIRNMETNRTYFAIQSAISASETLDGHTILVRNHTYYEHIVVNKTLNIIGESRFSTTIDGNHTGTVVYIDADRATITGFTISNSGSAEPPYGEDCGIYLNRSTGSRLSQNHVTSNRIGIYSFYSSGNAIEDNNVSFNSENGILLWYSGNNTVTGNIIFANTYNFGVMGGSFQDFNNIVDKTNTVNEKPIHYLIGLENAVIANEVDIGALYLVDSDNITIRNITISNNLHGIYCYGLTNSLIQNVRTLNNSYGICVQNSYGNIITENECPDNWVGIFLYGSDNNTIFDCITENCEKGISLYNSDNCLVEANTISSSDYGIRLFSSHLNHIWHNNFVQNVEQASVISSMLNDWDDGFEGNFWSDHTEPDEDKNGIVDQPRYLEGTDQDSFPLAGQFHVFNVGEDSDTQTVSFITNSTISSFSFDGDLISLLVEGQHGTYGFCRVRIPYELIDKEIVVIIDKGMTEVLHPNYSLRDNGLCRWIYFAYLQSSHEIAIVAESWWGSILVASLLLATAVICFESKLHVKRA